MQRLCAEGIFLSIYQRLSRNPLEENTKIEQRSYLNFSLDTTVVLMILVVQFSLSLFSFYVFYLFSVTLISLFSCLSMIKVEAVFFYSLHRKLFLLRNVLFRFENNSKFPIFRFPVLKIFQCMRSTFTVGKRCLPVKLLTTLFLSCFFTHLRKSFYYFLWYLVQYENLTFLPSLYFLSSLRVKSLLSEKVFLAGNC